MGWIILCAIIGGLIWALVSIANSSNTKKTVEIKLKKLNGVSVSDFVLSTDNRTGLAVDTENKKAVLIDCANKTKIALDVIDYTDVISTEVFDSGESTVKTVRSSQLGGAIVGGIFLGGAGAVIGGLSGKKKTVDKSNQIELRLTVNRPSKPLHNVHFLEMPTKKNGIVYNVTMEKARHWNGLIEILIREADRSDNQTTSALSAPTSSAADEIKKLAGLLERGLISEGEFTAQKTKLLG